MAVKRKDQELDYLSGIPILPPLHSVCCVLICKIRMTVLLHRILERMIHVNICKALKTVVPTT